MGKKGKVKVKFIDKKQAISFHLVAKAAPGLTAEEEAAEEMEELAEELRQQKLARRRRLGLEPEEEAKEGADDEEEEEQEESFIPPPVADDRINLMNLAAAAEGVETRAVRLAKKAIKETKQQKFYLQPNYRPGSNVQLPADFPTELLYTGQGEYAEEEYWAQEDQRKYELELQADAPSLLPHNYDYEKHLRPMSGRGLFLEAKRGDEMYDAEMDPRDQEARPISGGGVAADGSASSSSAEAPANPELLASVEAFQRRLLKTNRRVRPTKDFVKALDGDVIDEEGFEELQDDFVMQAMTGGADDDAEEDEEEYEDGEEYYEEEDEEKDEDGDSIPRTLRHQPKKSSSYQIDDEGVEYEDDEGEDEEDGEDDEDEDGKPKDGLDAAFDKLLDEYEDDEIGELDHYIDEHPEEMEGNLELEEVDGEMDEYLTQKEKFKSEGGNIIDKVANDLQQLTLAKLAIVTRGEKGLAEIEGEIEAMLNPAPKDNWDAESILSTYSNTENHPRVLREGRRRTSRTPSEASVRSSLPAFQPALPVPASILRAARRDAGEDEDEDDLDEEEDDDVNRENKGKARAQDESLEDKKKRKQAVKQAQREAKERKKALKSLYVQETAAAMDRQARLNQAHLAGKKL